MFKHWMEIVHTMAMAIVIGCFTRTFFLIRVSTSIMFFNGKGFTIEGLFRSLFTELAPGFL